MVEAGRGWLDDRCDRLAASLSYYAIFSLFPLALLAITGLGYFLGDAPGTREKILASLDVTGSPALATLLDGTLASMQQHQTARGVGAVVGVATLLFGASGFFSELQSAFNLIWHVPDEPTSGVWGTIRGVVRGRTSAFLLVLLAALVLLASLVTSTGLAAVQRSSPDALSGAWLWAPVELLASTAFLAAILVGLFCLLPRVPVRWRQVAWAAGLTAVAFSALKKLLTFYLAHVGSFAAYGVVGGLLGFLTWVYVSSMLLYFGVELARVYAGRYGGASPA